MAKVAEEAFRLDEVEKIHSWRVKVCLDLGYSTPSAERIAWSKADLHQLADLLDRGCDRQTAKRIVL